MITNAKAYVFATPVPGEAATAAEFKEALDFNPSAMTSAGRNLWGKDVPVLIARLEDVLKLNEAYQEDYRLTKESLGATPSAKQFNFDDAAIFGRMDLYCRRVIVSGCSARAPRLHGLVSLALSSPRRRNSSTRLRRRLSLSSSLPTTSRALSRSLPSVRRCRER